MLNKIILGLAAASVLAAPAAAAPFNHNGNAGHNDRGRVERVVNNRQFVNSHQVVNYRQAPRFRVGQRFDRQYASHYRIVQNPRLYRLRDAPRGYRWVQSGNDAVLVAITSGLIASILANAF